MVLDAFNITPDQCIGTGPAILTLRQRVWGRLRRAISWLKQELNRNE